MFFKILKKDLQRKKAMNIILFVFIIIASMLIASSVNMLYTTTTALDQFKKVSNISDNIVIAFSNEEKDKQIEQWAKTSNKVRNFSSNDMLYITADNITLPLNYKKLKDDSTLALGKVPKEYNLVFHQDDERFILKNGEVALPMMLKEKYGIQLGDKVTIKIDNCEKILTVKYYMKDVVFGSGLMGFKRIMISDQDFDDFNKVPTNLSNNRVLKIWSIIKNDNVTFEEVEKDFSKSSIDAISIIDSDIISTTYIMDLIISGIMIVVSIFLMFISFLILRFTIVFTIEEDYKEIGIMKAIGLKNRGIKGIYMVKYLFLAMIGGGFGFIASIPFTKYLMKSVSEHIMMKVVMLNYLLAVISVVFIVLITVGFCYLCTRKINKLTAIDAIRQGSTGERFANVRKLKLHNMAHINAPIYLALSDLICGYRRFIILMITFILGTAIIIIPTNVINTLSSDKIVTLFGMSEFDINIASASYIESCMKGSIDELLENLKEVEQKSADIGIAISVRPEVYFMPKVYADNPEESKSILSLQAFNYSTDHYTYLSGTAPKLDNEVAITSVVAEYFGVGLGDTIHCTLGGNTEQFIVTALFQSMNNMGYDLRFPENHELKLEDSTGLGLFGTIEDGASKKQEKIEILKEEFPELDIENGNDYIKGMLGSISGQLGLVKNIILFLVLGINFLITCLLVRMMITKEIPEIAVLKSTGFQDKDIRTWQVTRIAIVLIISIFLGTIIANATGGLLTSGIFRILGATKIILVIKPLQVYVIYPIVILVITLVAVLVSLGQVRKTHIWEINNQE